MDLWLNGWAFMIGWGIYGLNGGAVMTVTFIWKHVKKWWSSGEYPFQSPIIMVTRGKGETNVQSLDVSCPNGVSVRAVRLTVGSSVPFWVEIQACSVSGIGRCLAVGGLRNGEARAERLQIFNTNLNGFLFLLPIWTERVLCCALRTLLQGQSQLF